MDWDRIINVFIAIFLVINIAIFSLSKVIEHKRYTLSEERLVQLREILKENGYALYDHVPDFYPMQKMVLESPKPDKDKIKARIFDGDTYSTSFTANVESYLTPDQRLMFYKGDQKGLIRYTADSSRYVPKTFTREDVEKIAEEFVDDITLSIPKMELTYIVEYNDYFLLEYNEVYKEQILFCSYVKMKVTAQGVTEATALRYTPKELTGDERTIRAIDEVLFNFVSIVKPEEDTFSAIKKIDLGYHLAMSSVEDNILIEAVPYYRIKLNSGEVYYINAYTNELMSAE